jgi:creatinine amidohydrolase
MKQLDAMENTGPIWWEDLTWEEIPSALAACGQAVLWPFGATEQHGPHLGLGVDTCIAREVCAAVSARTHVPVLPALPIGCSLGHTKHWPGTLSLRPSTLIALVTEVGEWLHAAGVRRLFLINAHVTNFAPLRCGLEELRFRFPELMVALRNTAEVSLRTRERFFAEGPDWHANAAETALMLHLHPAAVRSHLSAAADDPDRTPDLVFAHPVAHTSTNGVTGFPSRATVEQGRELFTWMVEDLSDLVRQGCAEAPPLPSPLATNR